MRIKVERNYFEKVHRNKILSKRDFQTTLVFDISKTYQKEISKPPWFSVFQNYIKISTSRLRQFYVKIASKKKQKKNSRTTLIFRQSKLGQKNKLKQCWVFTHRIYVEESTSKRFKFFTHQKYLEKVRQNDVEIRRHFPFGVSA